jgi:hypothetical protein
MHVYLCCLPSSVSMLRCSARESFRAAKLCYFLCTFTCVACPPLSPRYGAPPGSPSVQPNSVACYARLPVLPALLCLRATVLRQGVLQGSVTSYERLPVLPALLCLHATALRQGVLQGSVTSYERLPVLPALLYLHTTVLRQGVLQCSQLRDFRCTVNCVACPPLSPRYGAPPGSPSVQPNSMTSYARSPVLPALLCLHATVLRQGVIQCSQLCDFLCTVTCVACPPLSPCYGAPPGSPSVQPTP